MTLNPFDQLALRAFLATIANLESSLPPQVQQQLNDIGNDFADNTETAIDSLIGLTKQDCLSKYVEFETELRKLLRSQERNKFGYPPPDDPSSPNQPDDIPNTSVLISTGEFPEPLDLADLIEEFPLEPMEILRAPDSVTEIKAYINRVRSSINDEVSVTEILNVAPLIYEEP
jgi:hypothetical protein